MPDKPLTRNTSLIELGLTIAGFLVVIGITYGSMAAEQKTIAEKVEEDHQAIKEIKDDLSSVKTDIAVIQTIVTRIEKAVIGSE